MGVVRWLAKTLPRHPAQKLRYLLALGHVVGNGIAGIPDLQVDGFYRGTQNLEIER